MRSRDRKQRNANTVIPGRDTLAIIWHNAPWTRVLAAKATTETRRERGGSWKNKRASEYGKQRKKRQDLAWSRERPRVIRIIRTLEYSGASRDSRREKERKKERKTGRGRKRHRERERLGRLSLSRSRRDRDRDGSYHHTTGWPLTSLHHIWSPRVHHNACMYACTMGACASTGSRSACRSERIDRSMS